MKKRLAVLLLRMEGAPDNPSKSYAEKLFTNAGKGTANLVDYYLDMSHGKLNLGDSTVFDWINYGHTNNDLSDEWKKAYEDKKEELLKTGLDKDEVEEKAAVHANGMRRHMIKQWAREAAINNNYDLSGFDILVCVFNQPVDYFGSYGEVVLQWDETNNHTFLSMDLTGVAHEMGHALGLTHSRSEGSDAEYGDPWDIMSAYSGVFYDISGTLTPPGSDYFTFGPGLNAVNMDLAGWLDPQRIFTGSGSNTFTLRPLHRRDLKGWLAARIQLGFSNIFVEFRIKNGWDKAIPEACVLLHQHSVHPEDGRPCSSLIVAQPKASPEPRSFLRSGESYELGDINDPFGFYARITVNKIDTAKMEAQINVHVRHKRPIEPQGTPFGGVTVDGGGWVFTPGRGFVIVPPRSPLLSVLEVLSDFQNMNNIPNIESINHIESQIQNRLKVAASELSALVEARNLPHVPAPANLRSLENNRPQPLEEVSEMN